MGIVSKRRYSRHDEELSLYAHAIEWEATKMAMDSYFAEVIDGNVPLTREEHWWDRQVIGERVNRFNENWCVLFTALAMMRNRVDDDLPKFVRADANLKWEALDRDDQWQPVNWES